MTRLRVREVLEHYKLPRTRVAIRAQISSTTMERIWKNSENIHVEVYILDEIAKAMTTILKEEKHLNVTITVHDLLDVS